MARLSYACDGESRSVQRHLWRRFRKSAAWAPMRPGAERGTVNGMLPDFRFVLGAILAIAVLAVAGLGLATSVQLAHEARMNPIEDARSLAFAGHAEWNQFYDPEGARRFEGLAGKTEGPVAGARLETAAETSGIAPPVTAPAGAQERTAGIPANRLDPDIAPVIADDKAPDQTPETDLPHADPAPAAETPAAVTIAAPPAEAAGVQAPDVPGTTVAPSARVASAPADLPGPDLPRETHTPTRETTQAPAQPQATGGPLQDSAPPTPRARPKAHFRRKIARAHIRNVAPVSPQTVQNSGFPTAYTPWPGFDTQFTGATTKKNTGKLTGTLANRPQ
jgi:hypothetical protein